MLAVGQLTSLRSKVLPVLSVAQQLDSLTVVPGSVSVWDVIGQEEIPSWQFRLHGNSIVFDSALVAQRSKLVRVSYRVLPINLGKRMARIDSAALISSPADQLIGVRYDPFAEGSQPLLPQRGLNYDGNFTRGISFGNNQSLVLNSQFNLQMSGRLRDVEVLAAITDNNIPIQPEGNTQQLREFDKIFVQIGKGGSRLIAGDYELTRPPGYFMNYTKKLQGATFSNLWAPGSILKGTLLSQASLAVARGKFARNEIAAIEGNQGPYRLQGAEGEQFIIVLAGTEKVYLDGELLQRGLDLDYVIDYNAGHITFMPRRLITKDSRIVVEFDYADQNYLRSLYALSNDYHSGQLHLYLHAYSEQDGLQPVDEQFDEEEKLILRNAGDDELAAVVSSLDSLTQFNAFRVSYELRDTVVNGVLYSGILVYSTNANKALYTATFTEVGQGNGNYVQDTETAANGRVFRWVAPDALTGRPSGNYEPVRRLVAPKRQQLFTAGGQYHFSKKTILKGELALSNTDLNRFSHIADDDNTGLAAMLHFGHEFDLKMPFGKKSWQVLTSTNYEFAQQRFRELSPYRSAEFTRDWNTSTGANDVSIGLRPTNEHLLNSGIVLRTPSAGSMVYRFGGFFRDTLYTGTRQFAKYAYLKNGFDFWLQTDWLNTESTVEASRFSRPKVQLAVPLFPDSTGTKYWRAGIYGEQELNSRYAVDAAGAKSDSLRNNSFRYDLFRLFLETPASENIVFKAAFKRRLDHSPSGRRFRQSLRADELNIEGNWLQSRNSRLNWNFTWRQLTTLDTNLSNQQPTKTYLGRLNYSLNILRGVVQSATNYEIGSGQERKVEFTYLQVPQGEGTHQWIDRNADNAVQIDEVEIAPFQDVANAVRITTFTDDLIRTNNVQFNQSLRLEPKAVWFSRSGLRKVLAKFSTQSSLQITRKVRDLDGVSPWNLFQLNVTDTALVSTRAGTFNALFFNRAHPRFDAQLGHSNNELKQVLTTGYESRRLEELFLRVRWNLTHSLAFHHAIRLTTNEQGSEFFDNRRYRIEAFELEPKFTYQPSASLRASASWRHHEAENTLGPNGESAKNRELKLEIAFNQSATTSIRSEISLVKINFRGEANSPVGFAFLNGLQNGRNYLWNLTLDRQIGPNIRMSISYEGRKTGNANPVHVGRAQLGAVF